MAKRSIRKPSEVLKAARAKIARGWTQGAYGRDALGNVLSSKDPKAVRWCMAGALDVVSQNWEYERKPARALLKHVIFPFSRIMEFNDASGRTQAEVLAKFDEAIALAESKEFDGEKVPE